MEYRTLGKTGLNISAIGMGCSGIGKSLHHRDDEESLKTLRKAFEYGINFFDTAPNYSNGESEILIAEALGAHRNKIIISTKVGTTSTAIGKFAKKIKPYLNPVKNILHPLKYSLPNIYKSQRRHDFSEDFIIKTVEGSLRRLQTDYVDLLLLHHPSKVILESGDFCKIFEILKSEGKIRFYGVSCDSIEHGFLSLKLPNISALQIELSMIDQDPISELLPLALEKNIGVIARLPLGKGLLADHNSETKAERWVYDKNLLIERKNKACKFQFLKNKNRTMAQSALQFVLRQKGVSCALTGFNNRNHLEENIKAFDVPQITNEELNIIRSL